MSGTRALAGDWWQHSWLKAGASPHPQTIIEAAKCRRCAGAMSDAIQMRMAVLCSCSSRQIYREKIGAPLLDLRAPHATRNSQRRHRTSDFFDAGASLEGSPRLELILAAQHTRETNHTGTEHRERSRLWRGLVSVVVSFVQRGPVLEDYRVSKFAQINWPEPVPAPGASNVVKVP